MIPKPVKPEKAAPKRIQPKCKICRHSREEHFDGKADGCSGSGPTKRGCLCLIYTPYARPPRDARFRAAPVPRKAQPIKRKAMPRCKHCAHPWGKHLERGGADVGCSRCSACPGYKPARGIRQKRRTPLAALRRLLWDLFRVYVYERDGNVCFSSGAGPLEGSNRHAGHLFNAGSSSLLRWHPKNVHVQSYRDNVTLRGNIGQYTAAFLDRYGVEEFKRLAKLARVVKKWTAPEVSELIEALKRSPADFELLYEQKHCLPALAGMEA